MTRRPLQQLPFLRRVPRECSPVGQYISIGSSEKEIIITHADAMRARFAREKFAAPLAFERCSYEKAEESRAHGWPFPLSPLCRVALAPSTTDRRVKAVARHASYPAASILSALGQSVRAHRRQNLTLQSPRRHSLPLRGYPFRRADRPFVFLVLAMRRVTASASIFIGCPSGREPLGRSTWRTEAPFISARQSPWTNDVDRATVHTSIRTWVTLWTEHDSSTFKNIIRMCTLCFPRRRLLSNEDKVRKIWLIYLKISFEWKVCYRSVNEAEYNI